MRLGRPDHVEALPNIADAGVTRPRLIDDPRDLLRHFLGQGYRILAPQERDGVIDPAPLTELDALRRGRVDDQGPGHYRLRDGDPDRWFDYVVGPSSWKAWLYPARRKLWSAERTDDRLTFRDATTTWPKTVLFGVRPCELAAIERQRRIFAEGPYVDTAFAERLAGSIIVVVQCARSAPTCFCASMDTGPRAESGYDLALTELPADHGAAFLVESGSQAGDDALHAIGGATATPRDYATALDLSRAAAAGQTRTMPDDIADGLKLRLESPVWADIASRCLTCGNCTLACPTCFCSDVEEVSDLSGEHTERWQLWDSCFNPDFGFIHGGPVRSSPAARYRQWMTHKLSYWHDQFGSSGCVGCGRCITWCPVGIDLVAEADRLMAEGTG